MSDKLPCCGNDKIILVDISDHFERKIECSECGTQYYQNKTTGELTKIGKKKKAPDMSDKRPWTPGPWEFNGDSVIGNELQKTPVQWFAKFHIYSSFEEIGSISKQKARIRAANAKLASKAPDMAELLIEMVEKHDFITEHIGPTELSEHIHRARYLLKEIGYETP